MAGSEQGLPNSPKTAVGKPVWLAVSHWVFVCLQLKNLDPLGLVLGHVVQFLWSIRKFFALWAGVPSTTAA